jgi:hypothetical protein
MPLWFKFLIPTASGSDLRKAAGLALAGAIIAGCFGIIHDQITYTISPEYFTRMKFDQFRWADFGFPKRVFVAEIGFLATWWVGLVASWFLARLALPKFKSPQTRVIKAVVYISAITTLFSVTGYLIGPWLFGSRPGWCEGLQEMGVGNPRAFHQVAGVHLASYVGALIGWLVMMVMFVKRSAHS